MTIQEVKQENCYTVYMHKNKINNKVYIGITKTKPKYRWQNGKGYNNQVFYKAIQKYGWDNFEHIILENNLFQKEAEEKEIYYIKKYKSYNPNYGYNVSKGGRVNNGVVCSEETKKKISIANKGKKNGMYGKHHTKEEINKISEASKKLWKNQEHRNKIIKILENNRHNFEKGHIPWNKGLKCKPAVNRKKVICLETGIVYNSIKEAETIENTNNISYCCNGKRKSTNGKHWKFYEE